MGLLNLEHRAREMSLSRLSLAIWKVEERELAFERQRASNLRGRRC